MWEKFGIIFDDHHCQLPVVDEYEKFYRIYYSTRIDGKSNPLFIDVDKNNPKKIIKKQNNPILKLGKRGSFDWAGIMPTDIISFGNIKYLYYIGWSLRIDVPYHNTLGLAISNDDGNTWTKFSDGPIFSTNNVETGYIGTVEILIENGLWKMWYLSCRNWIESDKKFEPIYDIKYAISEDGIRWNPTNDICINLERLEGGISSCRVIKENNGYKMWYSIRDTFDYRLNKNHSYRIKTANSSDGIVWNKNNNIDLDISDENEWENIMVCYPFIIEKNDHLLMFYNGNGFGKTGVGYAKQQRIK